MANVNDLIETLPAWTREQLETELEKEGQRSDGGDARYIAALESELAARAMPLREARLAAQADPAMQAIGEVVIIRYADDTHDYLPLGQPIPRGATIAARYWYNPNRQEWVVV